MNWIRGEIREQLEQEIERFDRESEAPETLAPRNNRSIFSIEEKSRPNVTVASFKSVLIQCTMYIYIYIYIPWRIVENFRRVMKHVVERRREIYDVKLIDTFADVC